MNQRKSLVSLEPWRRKKGARRRSKVPRRRRGASTHWVQLFLCPAPNGREERSRPALCGSGTVICHLALQPLPGLSDSDNSS